MAKFGFQIRSPVAYIDWPAEWQEKDIRSFYDQFGDALQKGKIRGEVWDLTYLNLVFTTASQRKLIAECIKQVTPFLHGHTIAAGRVVPNSMARGIATAVDWLTGRYEHPVQHFATHAEAERFVIDKLIAARIAVPDTARMYTKAWSPTEAAAGR